MTVTVSLPINAPSLAVKIRTYVPLVEKLAVVARWDAFAKVTVPGPLTLLQVVVTTPGGFGSPSSVTVPERDADEGNVIVWSIPAFTTGGLFMGFGDGLTATVADVHAVPLAEAVNVAILFSVTAG